MNSGHRVAGIAAIEACTNTTVEAVVGKPSAHMAQAILRLADTSPSECIMIGDRLETDVLMGLNAGMAGALTLTGATSEADPPHKTVCSHRVDEKMIFPSGR